MIPFKSPAYRRLNERFRSFSLRERSLLSAVAVATLFLLIDQSMIQPIAQERSRIERAIDFNRSSIETSRATITQLEKSGVSPERLEIANRAAQLRAQIKEIERRMQSTVESLVPPNAIVSVLEELLVHSDDLRLIELRSHAPQPITSGSDADEDDPENSDPSLPMAAALYRHGLTLEIEGSYGAATDYLKRIEASPWHLLWERFELRVEDHPRTRIKIDLHTISDQEEWIGV